MDDPYLFPIGYHHAYRCISTSPYLRQWPQLFLLLLPTTLALSSIRISHHNILLTTITTSILNTIAFFVHDLPLPVGWPHPAMASLIESSLTSNSIRRLQHRHSYMAKAPYQQHKSKKKLLHDTAMKLCPVLWLAPAIIRAHDKHEYEKDRKYVREVYVGYQEHKSRKNSLVGARGSGSIVDLHIYPAPVEWMPLERTKGDPWRSGKAAMLEDPWQLPPINEIV